jgi:hypothetical protein
MTVADVSGCVPEHLHWFSQLILDYYLGGRISTGEFLRWFHMPNSDYLKSSECIAHLLDPTYDYRNYRPGVLDGVLKSCPQLKPDCLT